MSRRRYSWNEKRIAKYVRAGRGQGTGAAYLPWLTTADVPSLGRSHRQFWSKSGRVHHLLSDGEYAAFLQHAYNEQVIDIREQFPLNRSETLLIAELLGILHPLDPASRAPVVMTTDLLITRRTASGLGQFAYAVKEDKDLNKARTIEKLEIERLYWAVRGIPWELQLSSEVKGNTALNLEWIFDYDAVLALESAWLDRVRSLLRAVFECYPVAPLRAACRLVDGKMGLAPGTALGIARALLWRKDVLVDLSLDPPVAEISCSKFSFAEVGHD